MGSRLSTLQFVVATVILGSLGIFATQAQLDARTIVFYRCLFGAIAMGIYCLFLGQFRALPKQDFFLAFSTGFLMVGNWIFFFEGILRIGVSVATIVYQVQPFILLVAGALLFQERLGLTKALLFLAALFGLILATGLKWNMIDTGSLLGVGFTLLAATLYAGVVLVGKGLKSVTPEIVTFVQCAVGVLTLPLIDPAILHTSIELRQWGWLSGLGVIHTALVYALIYHALPKLKSSTIAILTFIYPASAIFFDFAVNGKLLSPVQMLGLVIIVLASFGITQGWELPKLFAARLKLWSSPAVRHEDGGVT
ncbi:MAG: DMT family transporter [Verrucomicrobia bacterium]|nr:DMT family transporter [Verrucomicrobiota bacterium]